jgi:hypothetical protein
MESGFLEKIKSIIIKVERSNRNCFHVHDWNDTHELTLRSLKNYMITTEKKHLCLQIMYPVSFANFSLGLSSMTMVRGEVFPFVERSWLNAKGNYNGKDCASDVVQKTIFRTSAKSDSNIYSGT